MMAAMSGRARSERDVPVRHVDPRDSRPGRPGSTPTELDLSVAVWQAQKGDEEAFRLIYRTVQPGLLRYLRGLVGDDAEDVASEAWSQIARDLGSFQRRRRRLPGLGGHHRPAPRPGPPPPAAAPAGRLDLLDRRLTDLAAADDTAVRALEAVATDSAIALIATLPRDQAEAVLLRVVMGLDVATAGRVLGKRAGAVRTATHRGLRRLADRLADDERPRTTDRDRVGHGSNAPDGQDAEGREMGADRKAHRPDAAAAERLLDGRGRRLRRPLPPSRGRLGAGPPATRLAGETGAMVAFRYANLGRVRRARRRSTAKPMWARLASVKVAAIAAALATAGVALAAGTGVLPSPLQRRSVDRRRRASRPASQAAPPARPDSGVRWRPVNSRTATHHRGGPRWWACAAPTGPRSRRIPARRWTTRPSGRSSTRPADGTRWTVTAIRSWGTSPASPPRRRATRPPDGTAPGPGPVDAAVEQLT